MHGLCCYYSNTLYLLVQRKAVENIHCPLPLCGFRTHDNQSMHCAEDQTTWTAVPNDYIVLGPDWLGKCCFTPIHIHNGAVIPKSISLCSEDAPSGLCFSVVIPEIAMTLRGFAIHYSVERKT